MAEQSPDYKKLFLEEQRRREEEQRRREEEQRRREEEQRRREEEQRRREEEQRRREAAEQAQDRAEEKTRKTTLPEFLNACHTHLHSGLTVQTDATLSTRGDPANATNKLRPENLVLWEDFPAQQAAIWDVLMASDFTSERHFTSLHTLEESGQAILRKMMSSELDLHLFQRSTVDDPVTSIIERLYDQRTLRQTFGLKGSVQFENHANTLSPETELEEGIGSMTVSGAPRRRSPRLQARTQDNPQDRPESTAAPRVRTTRSSRPRADQFCVYNTSIQNRETRIAAYITEYKPPHKLPLGCIYEGLEDMELDEVVRCRETDTPRDRFRRLIAAVITQAFSYMVKLGVEYGCVCTGEAFIFLRVPDDPKTVYYFLSVPKGDVGGGTGWAPDSDGPNRLHLTAVGQMLAFTLQALKTPRRSHQWRVEAASRLNSWEVVYEDLLDAIPEEDAPSSEYRPPRHNGLLRMSPVQLRRRYTPISSPSCTRPQDQHAARDEDPDSDTPSRRRPSPQHISRAHAATSSSSSPSQSSRRGQSGRYCTQNCLLGLVNGGLLDMSCPNVRDHGQSYHQIDRPTFLTCIRQQLSSDLDTDCKPVSLPGACGVLFRVRLKSHGYTVAAKLTPIDFVPRLQHEAAMYDLLRPIQGLHVPVHLGNIDLATPYYYEGICELVHMMFLSFGGQRISQRLTTKNRPLITKQVDYSARAIHNLGVLHKDLEPRNILWNEETGRVMVIDFERAEVVKPRTVLGVISPNRKRKRGSAANMAKQGVDDVFVRERRRATTELRGLT
ncbi:hypothetical protein F5883DRAFT_570921 [Diaporthe sp. PMI_573]|nr:hypothetical protein F5883DRAFT_570921 [Diaporthaceae sp. PMI_573]